MNPSDIAFSICIPAYNCRPWITETLESVRNQTHSHWEIIVVDDGSLEPCRDLVEAFAASVPQRVVYHVNATNLGTPYARDEAHRLARHDYIAPLDSDDIWKPEHLAEFASLFATRDLEFVFTGCTCFHDQIANVGVTFTPTPPMLDHLRLAMLRCQFWTQPSSFAFARKLLQRIGPWSKGMDTKRRELPGFSDSIEDRNFCLNVIHAGVDPVWTGTVTTYYRQHAASALHTAAYRLTLRAWADNAHGLMSDVPAWTQRLYLSQSCANGARALLGVSHYRTLSAKFYLRAWRWNPLRVDRLAQAVLVLMGFTVKRPERT